MPCSGRKPARGLPFLACVALAGATRAAVASSVDLAPPSSWVQEMPLPKDVPPPADDVRAGTHYLVADEQVRVSRGTLARYRRFAYEVLSTAGVQEASEIKIGFDPSYQRLTLHHVRLWRGGKDVRAFRAAEAEVIHAETELNERLYNGSLTALVFLKDVRPGDVVDFAYTVAGQNPILDGRFVDELDLAYSIPVARLRYRLLWPAARTLHVKRLRTELEPEVEASGANRVYVWERRQVPAQRQDESTPVWFSPYPKVQLTEFGSWEEVAGWARRVFASQARSSAALDALVAEWRREPTEEARARKAVRFVQDEIRYLGIEMGPSSHRPHPPSQVLDQRFGDCKDKALLLTTLLAGLGVEAAPALVNTGARRGLDDWAPSPFAFDHVIVQARVDGATVWIDATQSELGGPVSRLPPPPFERALLLREGAVALTAIPPAERKEPTTVVRETYTLARGAAPATLSVETTYRGRDADRQRQSLARESRTVRAERYLNYYAREDARVKALHPPRFHDDRDENVVVCEESYEIPGFWKQGERHLYPWAVGDELDRPTQLLRSMPLRVAHPVDVEHQLVVRFADRPDFRPHRRAVTSPGFSLEMLSELQDRTLTLTYRYRSLRESLPASDTRRHLADVSRAEDALGYSISNSRGAGLATPRTGTGDSAAYGGLVLLGLVLAGGGTMAFQAFRARARRRAFKVAAILPEGDSPASALVVADDGALARAVAGRACSCGARGSLREVERHGLSFDRQSMLALTTHCVTCGRDHTVYARLTIAPLSAEAPGRAAGTEPLAD